MQELIKAELKKKERRRKLLLFVFVMLMLLGFGGYFFYYRQAGEGDDRSEQLANLKGSTALSKPADADKIFVATLTDEDGTERKLEVLDQYKTLYNSNKDLIGWIKIADTNIDYPVMQAADNEYYLTHNFDRKEEKAGALFLDCNCDIVRGNDNFIIYGHHLTSGRMFSKLEAYESKQFYDTHSNIQFDTIYEKGTYKVMYAFRSRVYDSDQVVFKYYQFIDAESEEEFNSYMNEMAAASFYDTGVRAVYGDRLLTLSTCDYQEENGRFVVVAKKIK